MQDVLMVAKNNKYEEKQKYNEKYKESYYYNVGKYWMDGWMDREKHPMEEKLVFYQQRIVHSAFLLVCCDYRKSLQNNY